MTLDVEKLHPLIGAKVRGVDFRQPMSTDVMEELNHIWMDNLVLVFPDQPVTDEEHVAATRAFGEPEVFHQNIIKSRKVPEIFRVSNVDDDGNLMMPEHPTMQQLVVRENGIQTQAIAKTQQWALFCMGLKSQKLVA